MRYKRFSPKTGFLVVVYVLASLFMSTAPVFQQMAFASTASEIAKSDKYYARVFLKACLERADSISIKPKDSVGDGSTLFEGSSLKKNDNTINIGMLYDNSDGKLGCRDGVAVDRALSDAGLTAVQFLTSIGYKSGTVEVTRPVSSNNCESPLTPACETITETVDVYTLNGKDPNFTNYDKATKRPPAYTRYVTYSAVFNDKCSLVVPPEDGSNAVTVEVPTLSDSGESWSLKNTKASFPFREATSGTPSNGTTLQIDTANDRIKNFDYDGQSINCKALLEEVNKLASSVIAYNDKNLNDPITASALASAASDIDCTANPNDPGCTDSETSCAVQGIGWIVCPVITFIGELNDQAFNLLSKYFLEIENSLIEDPDNNATFKAWESFRDIANVMFVIAFVAIVYAQMIGGRS